MSKISRVAAEAACLFMSSFLFALLGAWAEHLARWWSFTVGLFSVYASMACGAGMLAVIIWRGFNRP